MINTRQCKDCSHAFPLTSNHCPHCGRPSLFPNVDYAEIDAERHALQQRYEASKEQSTNRGCEATLQAFEDAAEASQAVIARSFAKTLELASGDRSVVSTYYRELRSGSRLPDGNRWDHLRTVADDNLFGDYKHNIRFAALSLDGKGLDHYGDCSWILRDDMVAHRASVFEANSAVWVQEHVAQTASLTEPLPAGYRAPWSERSKLCVAKLGDRIEASTQAAEFAGVLLCPADDSADDDFVEVHIGGPMTIRTLERIVAHRGLSKALCNVLRDAAAPFGIVVEGAS